MWAGVVAIAAFAALPFVRLVANNPDYPISLGRLFIYWIAISLSLTIVLLVVAHRWEASAGRLGATLALAVYVIGFLAVATRNTLRLGEVAGVDGAVWLAAGFILAAVLVTRWESAQSFVLLLGILLLLALSVQSVLVRLEREAGSPLPIEVDAWKLTADLHPNVYWFIVDGYGRGDVIRQAYQFPEQFRFLEELEIRGFSVSNEAVAAYPLTELSLASTLLADYVAAEGDILGDRTPFYEVIQGSNPVVATFKLWGYRYLHVPADFWPGSQCSQHADVCIASGTPNTEVDWTLLSMTPIAPFLSDAASAKLHAERSDPVTAVEAIGFSQIDKPFFALVHLINPHPPPTTALARDVLFKWFQTTSPEFTVERNTSRL